jgi:hypothetical protein
VKGSVDERANKTVSVMRRLIDLGFKGNVTTPIKDGEFGTLKAEWFIDPDNPPAILRPREDLK